jgi:hypothetical protein
VSTDISPAEGFWKTFEEMCKYKQVPSSGPLITQIQYKIAAGEKLLNIPASTSSGQVQCLFFALRHSPLFHTLRIENGDQIGESALEELKQVLRYNPSLKNFTLQNVAHCWKFTEAHFEYFLQNTLIHMRVLRYIHTPINLKGAKSLALVLRRFKPQKLFLSNCEISSDEIQVFSGILQIFKTNPFNFRKFG